MYWLKHFLYLLRSFLNIQRCSSTSKVCCCIATEDLPELVFIHDCQYSFDVVLIKLKQQCVIKKKLRSYLPVSRLVMIPLHSGCQTPLQSHDKILKVLINFLIFKQKWLINLRHHLQKSGNWGSFSASNQYLMSEGVWSKLSSRNLYEIDSFLSLIILKSRLYMLVDKAGQLLSFGRELNLQFFACSIVKKL